MSSTAASEPQLRQPASYTLALLTLAAPIIAMTVSRMLMGFIDFVMVSQLGTAAQAAISPASIFIFVVGCLGMGIANGVQTFVSQADGRGEPHLAGGYAWQTFYIAGAMGLLAIPIAMTADTWFAAFARLGNHAPDVAAMEVTYVRIALHSVAPAVICIGLNGFFNGVQKPWVSFVAVVASLVTNAFGNWVLIFGNLGCPALGIAGAAYATVIAWWVRAGVLGVAMLLPSFDRVYHTQRSFAFNWQKMRGLLRIGAPTSLGWLVDIGSWMAFLMFIVPHYGQVAMAASNVALQYMHLCFMPAIGIGIALSSKVGFVIGEGQPDEAERWTTTAFRLSGLYMGAVGVAIFFFRDSLMWVFNDDPAVIAVGAKILIWVAIFQIFDAMMIVYMNSLRGAGDTHIPNVIVATCCWGLFIGGGLLMANFVPGIGIHGAWGACTVYITTLGLLLMWRWYGGAWRKIKLFDDQPAAAPAQEPAVVASASASAADLTAPETHTEPAPAGAER